MNEDDVIFDEHLLKISKWKKFKLWMWHLRNHKRISIWVRKEGEE